MPLRPEPSHPQGLALDPQAREAVLDAVDLALEAAVAGAPEPDLPVAVPGPMRLSGLFVSLHHGGQLRGCMGRMGRPMLLESVLMPVARLAACGDPRFPVLTAAELPDLTVEVWLLYGLAQVEGPAPARVGQIRVGSHGVELDRGQHHGVFLPSVAPEQGWDAPTLLAHLGLKAGLNETAWLDPTAILRVFQGICCARPSLTARLEAGGWRPEVA